MNSRCDEDDSDPGTSVDNLKIVKNVMTKF